MKYEDLEYWSQRAGNWAKEYFSGLNEKPVRAQVKPGEIMARLPESPPENPEDMDVIFNDFTALVPDGLTHWQHPRFFAYFNANAAPASIFAEQLLNTIAANGMLWQTSPSVTEIEERMIQWFRQAVGLPDRFKGLIQDTATTSTLCAVLTMRERGLDWEGLTRGIDQSSRLRIYASLENHSSIEKAIRVSGIGTDNLVAPKLLPDRSIDAQSLRDMIVADIESGARPVGLILCCGGTATGAIDSFASAMEVAKEFNLYVHVDAAWAGSAMICPEYRHLWAGIEQADSIVINPQKWLGMQMDCSVQLLANPEEQAKTVGLRPDYLRTVGTEHISNLSELTIGLGRRFRALKIWFTMRAYGLNGLRTLVRNHVNWIKELERKFADDADFEVYTSSPLALFGFRFVPDDLDANQATSTLCQLMNDDGRVYLTHTLIDGNETIRVTAGSYLTRREDVMMVYEVAKEMASKIKPGLCTQKDL